MQSQIVGSRLTPELRASINRDFDEIDQGIEGYSGVASDPIAFEWYEDGQALGVCVVNIFWGNLHIKNLIVKSAFRGLGIATGLMHHALAYGVERGCHFAYVETMSFQAPGFYKKLGFDVELCREGYAGGHTFYYLKKELV